ncbi:MAG: S8 family serine peptidase, partial [Defluviitaleaceae bacterium]|nr:S8 family serine peptidase [Defluviitaleaceae bacterium]
MQYEIIVKYSGDLSKIEAEIPAIVEPLNNSYAIITLDEADIDKLFTYKEIEFIEMPRALMISQSYPNIDELRSTCATPVLDSGNLTGEGTIVAILDSGINYKSKEFLNIETNETRIINIWDQNSKQGTPPAPFKLGTEYNKDEISSGTIQTVDELGHGTSVAAIAAGSTIGVSRGCSILIVKLPNSPKTTDLMRAISYSVNRARDLSMPIVINISFGTNDGSHDGFSLFERFIDEMSYEWKTNIVVAMGNEGDTGRHFTDTLTTGQTIDVEFYISANIRELSINLWKNFVDDFEFELYSPDGLISDKVFIESIIPNYLNTAEEVYLNFQNPEAGAWRLRVFGKRIVVGLFHMWLPISERIEAYFLAPNAEITLTIPATSFGVISVGAYNSALDTYASFSGRGNTRIFENVKPDIVAPGVSVYTMSANGSYEPKTGTSFAAPFVTGSVAILLQWGIVQGNDPFLYGQRIKAYLRKGATRAPGTTYPNKQWGYGKLCLAETLNLLNSNEYNKANFPNIVLPPIFNDEDLLIDGENSENIIPIENTTPSIEEELPNTAESFEAENTVPAMAFIAYNDNGVKDPLANFDNVLNVHERILSEDYIELVVRMNSNVSDFVNSSEEVFVTTLLTEYGILYIPKSLEAEFYNTFGKKIISEFPKNLALMGREALEASNITTVQNHPYLNLRGTGALVAIIDTGINYANESFVYEDNSTKIEYLWDQTLEGTPPAGFLFGNEFTAEEITEALQTGKLLQTTDEIGHGTNLAAIAAGREVAGTNKI